MIAYRAVRRSWLFGSLILSPHVAWAARSTRFRGQWSLGNLIGAAVVVGLLAALMAFFFWPGRRS